MSRNSDLEMKYPSLLFLLSFAAFWLAVKVGSAIRNRRPDFLDEDKRADLTVIQAATFTLLGIIIGFSFSMSVSRYDQRKNYEEEEANAIGTEYLRVELLRPADAAAAKAQLKTYLEQRIAWYVTRDPGQLVQIYSDEGKVGADLWSAVRKGVVDQPAAVVTLTVSGVNDVLNRQGYTEAAWLNRIPVGAWIMMLTVAWFGAFLLGIGARRPGAFVSLTLPFVFALVFFLIADLDSPRWGVIRVHPLDLLNLSGSLNPP